MKEKDNRPINWQKVQKRYKEVVGNEIYNKFANPFSHDIANNRHIISLSERDTGKTTNFLIVLLIIWWEYGYSFAYVRSDVQQLTVAKLEKLYEVIHEYDYISIITGGKYNHVFYDRIRKVWNLVKLDREDGDEVQEEPFCYGLSIHAYDDYKSTLNLPKCETFLFDEFINQYCFKDDFVKLCHLMSTVFRHRLNNPRVIYLANTLTKYHFFFSELGIQKLVKYIKLDEVREFVTDKGTHISVHLIKNNNVKVKKQMNALLYGFSNPLLNSITGGEWDIMNYPHITRELADHCENLQRNIIVIDFLNEYLSLDLIVINDIDYIFAHNITIDKYDGPIYKECAYPTEKEIPLEYIAESLETTCSLKMIFYQNNEVGDLLKNILDYLKKR